MATKRAEMLVPHSIILDGKRSVSFNSVDVTQDGTVFYTESTTTDPKSNLTSSCGRLVKRTCRTGPACKLTVLMELSVGNGMLLSEEEDFILVNELGESRTWKYHLKGKYPDVIYI